MYVKIINRMFYIETKKTKWRERKRGDSTEDRDSSLQFARRESQNRRPKEYNTIVHVYSHSLRLTAKRAGNWSNWFELRHDAY